jgi:hypothetical protein
MSELRFDARSEEEFGGMSHCVGSEKRAGVKKQKKKKKRLGGRVCADLVTQNPQTPKRN